MSAKFTNTKGSVYYNVEADTDLKSDVMASLDLSGSFTGSALDLPLQNSLDLGQSSPALLAGNSLDPALDKQFGEFGNGLLASL